MGLYKKKISASEMGNVLYNFTVVEETHKTAMKHFSNIEGIDLDHVWAELILLTVFIVDLILRSGHIRERYGNKADEVLLQYLACFKRKTKQGNFSDQFIDLLEDRCRVYNKIIETDGPSLPRHFPSKIAGEFAKYCGVENNLAFQIAAMQEFGSIFGTIVDFIDNYRLNDSSEHEQFPASEDGQGPQLPPHEPLSKLENMKIIIDCPKCFQRLRILSGRHLRVICPKCGHVFEV